MKKAVSLLVVAQNKKNTKNVWKYEVPQAPLIGMIKES
jgi:hypothetical protein